MSDRSLAPAAYLNVCKHINVRLNPLGCDAHLMNAKKGHAA
jgi:hypothetical protein